MTVNKLYFVQHGIALSKADNPERPLSEQGIKQSRSIAQQLLTSGIVVSSIFHSGKLRARQTAEVFASTLNVMDTDVIEHLSPNDDVTLIKPHLSLDQAMYVGHLPHLEKLVSSMVTGNESPVIMQFQNSAVVCLEKSDNLFRIAWYLTPQLVTGE